MEAHLQTRFKCLQDHERNIHQILSQCGVHADPLYVNFRYDEICLALAEFKAIGLNLKTLLKFQRKVPGTIYPWNVEYNTLRQDVNRRFNVFPLIIVMASTECEVIQAYAFAQKYNIPLALRSGSHCFEGFSLGPGMVIDQSRRLCVRINLKKNTYTVEPGVLIGPLVDILSRHDLAIPIGSCPNNGFTGFCLGGGISLVTKKFGTGSDNIIKARILLADGRVVTASRDHHANLYWALRGAGIGNYGIVLSMKCQAYVQRSVYIYSLTYQFEQLELILPKWTQAIQEVRDNPEITSDFKVIGGGGDIQISGYYFGKDLASLELFLKPLRRSAQDFKVNRTTFADAVRAFAGKGRWFPFFKFKNAFLDKPFSQEGIEVIKKFLSGTKGQEQGPGQGQVKGDSRDYLVIDGLGGINDRISPEATAFSHRNYLGWVHINAQWQEQEEAPKKLAWITQFYQELSPSLTWAVYQNAPDLMLTLPLTRYYAPNLARLIKIKKKYDPDNVFNYTQSIPPGLSSLPQTH